MASLLSGEEQALLDGYWRAANYLSVGQIYLLDNPLLKKPLVAATHQASTARSLGNYSPGLNFIYTHLNRIVKAHDLSMIYLAGPGHGGPGIMARNAYLEGTYSEVYTNITRDEEGLKKLFKQFSFPGRHPQPRRTGDSRIHSRRR